MVTAPRKIFYWIWCEGADVTGEEEEEDTKRYGEFVASHSFELITPASRHSGNGMAELSKSVVGQIEGSSSPQS